MKRSPTSSCSSSSSSVGFEVHARSEKGPKHARSNVTSQNCKVNTSCGGGRRSSIYRGVTRHRWTGRFEAHLWDKNSWNNIQSKKGRQVYLGAYDTEEAAARSYDLAALKYWGPDNTTLNFPIETYVKELEDMQNVTRAEYLASLRRRSSGFSRGVSKYRGVARHHHNGRWEARIGRVNGNKYLYLGTYNTQEEAAAAYDMAAIEHRGLNAVTNFDISNYTDKIKKKNEPSQETETAPTSGESEEAEVEQETVLLPPQGNVLNDPVLDESLPAGAIMEPQLEKELGLLPWSFMNTTADFSDFQVPDLAAFNKDRDMHVDIFHGEGLEDDINFLCRPDPEESDFNLNTVFDSPLTSCGDHHVVGAAARTNTADNKHNKLLSSASSSPSSSTSWVSCNYVYNL